MEKSDRNFVSYNLQIESKREGVGMIQEQWLIGQFFGGIGGKCLQMAYESLTVTLFCSPVSSDHGL